MSYMINLILDMCFLLLTVPLTYQTSIIQTNSPAKYRFIFVLILWILGSVVNLKSHSSISRTVDAATAASVTATYVWHQTQLCKRLRMYGTASYVSCDVGGFTIFLLYSSIFRFIINVVVFDQFHFNSPCFTLCRHNNEHFIIF